MREDSTFAYISNEDVLAKLGHTEGVVNFQPKHFQTKFEESEVIYSESASDKGALTVWFAENIHGLCGHRTGDNAKEFEMPLVVAFYDIDYANNVKGTNSWESSRWASNSPALALPSATTLSS